MCWCIDDGSSLSVKYVHQGIVLPECRHRIVIKKPEAVPKFGVKQRPVSQVHGMATCTYEIDVVVFLVASMIHTSIASN